MESINRNTSGYLGPWATGIVALSVRNDHGGDSRTRYQAGA